MVNVPLDGRKFHLHVPGELTLEGLRVNQLKLTRNLSGTLAASAKGLHLQAQGPRPDEALKVQLGLPLFAADAAGMSNEARPASSSANAQPDGRCAPPFDALIDWRATGYCHLCCRSAECCVGVPGRHVRLWHAFCCSLSNVIQGAA